jgi:hypothetical protein
VPSPGPFLVSPTSPSAGYRLCLNQTAFPIELPRDSNQSAGSESAGSASAGSAYAGGWHDKTRGKHFATEPLTSKAISGALLALPRRQVRRLGISDGTDVAIWQDDPGRQPTGSVMVQWISPSQRDSIYAGDNVIKSRACLPRHPAVAYLFLVRC